MIRRLFKTGNSVVVALPKEALDALGLREGLEVFLELDRTHGSLVIAPAAGSVAGVDARFARQVADFIDEYRPALKALAQG